MRFKLFRGPSTISVWVHQLEQKTKPYYLRPSAALRFLSSAPVYMASMAPVYAVGPEGAWYKLGLVCLAYVVGSWLIESVAAKWDRHQLEEFAAPMHACLTSTAALVVVGELHGPLVGLYGLCVVSATLVTGPGAAGDFREQVFEPFFTTKPCGTGLGLATARSIISRAMVAALGSRPRDRAVWPP